MVNDIEKLIEAKNLIQKLANGINPLDNNPIKEESFINDPRIIRPLFYLSDYITAEIDKKFKSSAKPTRFILTEDQKSQIILPLGKIGVNDFAKAVNEVIDQYKSKKVSGGILNKKLKLLGILSEVVDEEGKRRTTINEKSEGYGIESVTKYYNDRQYQQVVFNDDGKNFLLKNIEKLMSYGE